MAILLTIDGMAAPFVETRFWMGFLDGAQPVSPILIDPDTYSQGTNQTQAGTYGQAIPYNGALYCTLWSQSDDKTFIFKSSDNGATWSKLDALNGPDATFVNADCFDGIATIHTVYQTDALAFGPKQFQDFDLASETWGSPYGLSGQPDLHQPCFLYKRPDGTLLVFTRKGGFGSSTSDSGVLAVSFDIAGDTWNTPFDPGTGFTALPNFNGTRGSVTYLSNYMDSAGRTGVFMQTSSFNNSPTIWDGRVFYQQINLDDSLGAFLDFPGQDANPQDLRPPPVGAPLLLPAQDSIVIPVIRRYPVSPNRSYMTVYVGTPISNPTWTEETGADGLDAAVNAGDGSLQPQGGQAAGCFDGTTMTFVWVTANEDESVPFARLRRSQSTNLADPTSGWSADTIYDFTVDGPPGFYPLSGGDQMMFLPSLNFVLTGIVPNRVRVPRAMIRMSNG